jgi:hypothetical protein
MLDGRNQVRLQEILRRESRSFLQYAGDAMPWTEPGEEDALAQVQALIEEEGRANGSFAKFLVRRRVGVPYLGSYPVAFTTLNFVSLDHLLPLLVDAERQGIGDLQKDLAAFVDSEARLEIQKFLELKERHLSELEALVVTHPETVSR